MARAPRSNRYSRTIGPAYFRPPARGQRKLRYLVAARRSGVDGRCRARVLTERAAMHVHRALSEPSATDAGQLPEERPHWSSVCCCVKWAAIRLRRLPERNAPPWIAGQRDDRSAIADTSPTGTISSFTLCSIASSAPTVSVDTTARPAATSSVACAIACAATTAPRCPSPRAAGTPSRWLRSVTAPAMSGLRRLPEPTASRPPPITKKGKGSRGCASRTAAEMAESLLPRQSPDGADGDIVRRVSARAPPRGRRSRAADDRRPSRARAVFGAETAVGVPASGGARENDAGVDATPRSDRTNAPGRACA